MGITSKATKPVVRVGLLNILISGTAQSRLVPQGLQQNVIPRINVPIRIHKLLTFLVETHERVVLSNPREQSKKEAKYPN